MMEILMLINNPPEPKITVGAVYGIQKKVRAGSNNYITVTQRMRAIAKYEHFVMFEHPKGWRECFSMWELARCIV